MTSPMEADAYVLALPTADTPVIPPHLVIARHAHHNSRFGDMVWSLLPLVDDPTSKVRAIPWEPCTEGYRDELRLVAWTFLNGELRNTFVRARGARMRTRLSPEVAQATVSIWMRFADWLQVRDTHTLGDCDRTLLAEYAQHLRDTGTTRERAHKKLVALTRLWAFDGLSAHPAGMARPPWDEEGMDDYLPAAADGGVENAREPLAEEVMGPLLIWALRFVEDLADDILAAHAEAGRLTEYALSQPSTSVGRKALYSYLEPLVITGGPVPTTRKNGKIALARTYIAGTAGASYNQVQSACDKFGLSALVQTNPGPCPLNAPITGRIVGRPWRQAIDHTEVNTLLKHLGTAAFIVCAYLTGARPQEVLAMRSGCCPDPEPGQGRHLLHVRAEDIVEDADEEDPLDTDEGDKDDEDEPHLLIRSRHFKTATEPDTGNYLPGGAERPVPWVAIAPVVRAIRVLERVVPDGGLLFDVQIHDSTHAHQRAGALTAGAIRNRIEDFVAWTNAEAETRELPGEMVPPDPHGNIGTARFRRSLAWHIARRPRGLIALAIQYGHMRTVLNTDESGRYGTRSRSGIHQVVDIETALATADTAAELMERFNDGEGISGPAARQALLRAATGPLFQGGLVNRDFAQKYTLARRHLARDGAVLYDNPHALLLCLYKRDRALCDREGQLEAPVLERCVPGCGNIVRTDEQAAALRERADQIDRKAARTPERIADRLRANAVKLRSWADGHDRTRFTVQENTA
ncbi:integrase [Streptomyces sp. NPDC048496]|uniref:integrase n=1 Tax=Streptomyces sp. NPDC048496 TaxID=3365558 RepID=UPI003713471C